jgi:hypothetical protein
VVTLKRLCWNRCIQNIATRLRSRFFILNNIKLGLTVLINADPDKITVDELILILRIYLKFWLVFYGTSLSSFKQFCGSRSARIRNYLHARIRIHS